MISRIIGKVIEKGKNNILVDISGICYEILIPHTVMERLQGNITPEGKISLVTYHYHQVEPSKSTPVLIGFINDIEKDFFEVFITVSGIGPRAALRALNRPISEIARAIDEGDQVFLRSLPGIGEQRAKEIIAKLQNKVGKFGLLQDSPTEKSKGKAQDIAEEALAVLAQLEYKKAEAVNMIKKALAQSPEIETTEELLNRVYKQKRK